MQIGKFTDFYLDVTKTGTKIPQEKYLPIGQYPIVDQGKSAIAGWWDDNDGIFEDVPAIIFGDHTRAIKYMVEPFFIGADGVKILRPANTKDNPKYLYYALQAAKIPDLGYSRHFKAVKELNIRTYSRSKQDEIVRMLEKLDYLIEQRLIEITCLDDLVKSRFLEQFENKHYQVEKLGTICSKITDGTHKTPTYLDEGVTFISAKNIVDGELDFADIKHISEEEYQEIQKRCQTDIFDILLSKSGSLGSPVIVKTKEKLGLFESLAVLKYDRDRLLPEFLCEQLKTDRVQRQFKTGTKGVAIKHLHLGVIADTDIIVPPLDEQKTFAAFVAQVDKSKLAVQQSLSELEILKKSLMQQYFS